MSLFIICRFYFNPIDKVKANLLSKVAKFLGFLVDEFLKSGEYNPLLISAIRKNSNKKCVGFRNKSQK